MGKFFLIFLSVIIVYFITKLITTQLLIKIFRWTPNDQNYIEFYDIALIILFSLLIYKNY